MKLLILQERESESHKGIVCTSGPGELAKERSLKSPGSAHHQLHTQTLQKREMLPNNSNAMDCLWGCSPDSGKHLSSQ